MFERRFFFSFRRTTDTWAINLEQLHLLEIDRKSEGDELLRYSTEPSQIKPKRAVVMAKRTKNNSMDFVWALNQCSTDEDFSLRCKARIIKKCLIYRKRMINVVSQDEPRHHKKRAQTCILSRNDSMGFYLKSQNKNKRKKRKRSDNSAYSRNDRYNAVRADIISHLPINCWSPFYAFALNRQFSAHLRQIASSRKFRKLKLFCKRYSHCAPRTYKKKPME